MSHATGSDTLEPERGVVRDNDPLLKVTVLNVLGSASSRAAAALGNDVVLDKALGGTTVGTVAEQEVGAAAEVSRDLVGAGSLKQLLLEGGRVLAKASWVSSNESGHDTSGVRAGHGGTREEVDDVIAGAPGAKNLLARGVDVNALADVRESGDLVVDVDRPDSDNVGVATTEVGRGGAAGVDTIVTGSN